MNVSWSLPMCLAPRGCFCAFNRDLTRAFDTPSFFPPPQPSPSGNAASEPSISVRVKNLGRSISGLASWARGTMTSSALRDVHEAISPSFGGGSIRTSSMASPSAVGVSPSRHDQERNAPAIPQSSSAGYFESLMQQQQQAARSNSFTDTLAAGMAAAEAARNGAKLDARRSLTIHRETMLQQRRAQQRPTGWRSEGEWQPQQQLLAPVPCRSSFVPASQHPLRCYADADARSAPSGQGPSRPLVPPAPLSAAAALLQEHGSGMEGREGAMLARAVLARKSLGIAHSPPSAGRHSPGYHLSAAHAIQPTQLSYQRRSPEPQSPSVMAVEGIRKPSRLAISSHCELPFFFPGPDFFWVLRTFFFLARGFGPGTDLPPHLLGSTAASGHVSVAPPGSSLPP